MTTPTARVRAVVSGTYSSVLITFCLAVAALLFSTTPSRSSISLTAAITALLALSLGISFGQGGLLSAAQAAFATVGAYATAIMTTRWELSPWLGLLVAIALSSAIAWALARLIVRLSPIALALATVTFSQILAVLLSQGGEFTGGFIGISGIPGVPSINDRRALQLFAWAAVLVVAVIYVHVRSSMQGTALRTIRYDAVLATGVGISVPTRLASVFALSGGIAGFAGWLYALKSTYMSPESLPILLSITVLMMTIIGGVRTVTGPIIGAIILTAFQNYLPGVQLQNFLLGAILLISLFLFPRGLAATNWSAYYKALRAGRVPTVTSSPIGASPAVAPDVGAGGGTADDAAVRIGERA